MIHRTLLAAAVIGLALSASKDSGAVSTHNASVPLSARAPYMGIDTWYAFGSHIDEEKIIHLAKSTRRLGFAAAGYRYVWLDAGWWSGARASDGTILVDRSQWPHGMPWLVASLHAEGLRVGIYTDAGRTGCSNGGSYGHYQEDVDTFATWGIDAVKVDFCGGNALHLDPAAAFMGFRAALDNSSPHRAMVFAVCNGAVPREYQGDYPPYGRSAYATYRFAKRIATSWRTGPDIGRPGRVTFGGVRRNIRLDAAHPAAAAPGHYDDPDYLVPNEGMTLVQARAQFTMWAVLSAPLMISAAPDRVDRRARQMFFNRNVMRIDQDRLGIQGRRIATVGGVEFWMKPLASGWHALALLNPNRQARVVTVNSRTAGFASRGILRVHNVWTHSVVPVTAGAGPVRVAASGAALLLVGPDSPDRRASRTSPSAYPEWHQRPPAEPKR